MIKVMPLFNIPQWHTLKGLYIHDLKLAELSFSVQVYFPKVKAFLLHCNTSHLS